MNRITTIEAAKILKCSPQQIRLGIQLKRFPIGFVVTRKRQVYIIYDELCKAYAEKLKKTSATINKNSTWEGDAKDGTNTPV